MNKTAVIACVSTCLVSWAAPASADPSDEGSYTQVAPAHTELVGAAGDLIQVADDPRCHVSLDAIQTDDAILTIELVPTWTCPHRGVS